MTTTTPSDTRRYEETTRVITYHFGGGGPLTVTPSGRRIQPILIAITWRDGELKTVTIRGNAVTKGDDWHVIRRPGGGPHPVQDYYVWDHSPLDPETPEWVRELLRAEGVAA